MNIHILIAHYPDESRRDPTHILACTHGELFTQTYLQLDTLLIKQPPGFLATMCGIANFYFPEVPSHFQAVQVATITAALPLSRRELEVAEEITKGTQPAEIATILNLSVKTISTYRARILDKLKVGSNAEVALAMRDYGRA